MYRTKLTYIGVSLAWICSVIVVSNGLDGYGYDHDYDPSLRDYHFDYHVDSRRDDHVPISPRLPSRRDPFRDPRLKDRLLRDRATSRDRDRPPSRDRDRPPPSTERPPARGKCQVDLQ